MKTFSEFLSEAAPSLTSSLKGKADMLSSISLKAVRSRGSLNMTLDKNIGMIASAVGAAAKAKGDKRNDLIQKARDLQAELKNQYARSKDRIEEFAEKEYKDALLSAMKIRI